MNHALAEMGYKPVVVDYIPKENNPGIQKLYRLAFKWQLRIRRKKLREFMEKHIPLTITYPSYQELLKRPPKSNVYMVGSDQVWTDEIFRGGVNDAFLLKFAKGGKKIAYASGTGKPYIDEYSLQKIAENLKSFDHISVREQSMRNQLKRSGIQDVEVVLDPVFLLSGEHYRGLAKDYHVPYKYLLIYSFKKNDMVNKIAREIAKNYDLKIVEIGGAISRCEADLFLKDLGIEEFLGIVNNAKYIITSSYHGTALSIILKKQFMCVLPKERSDRIAHLISLLGLQDRMVSEQSIFNDGDALKPIDYVQVTYRLENAIKSSINYLEKTLK